MAGPVTAPPGRCAGPRKFSCLSRAVGGIRPSIPRRVIVDNSSPPLEDSVLWTIIAWIVLGLIAGAVARVLVPGRDPLSIPATILLGVVGSFIGGFLGYVLFGKDLSEGALQPSGIIGSIIGAVIALLIYRAASRRRV